MSPINPNDPDALKALIKLVELSYNDLLQPAFRQIGSAAGTVLGLCNSALLPIKLLNAKTDAVFKANVRKLEAQVELIPEEKRVQIPPEIGVPILDRLTYVSNETLSDLFVNLLSSASSTDMFSTAHPSFIHVIDKLTPDEARILKHLYKNRSFGYITVRVYLHLQQDIDDSIPNYLRNVNPLIDILTQATRISELVGLQFPKNVPRYLDNLTSMGLIRVISDRHHISTEYDHLIEMYKGVIKSYELSPTTRKVEIKKGYFEISEMGSMFGLACNLSEITSDVETYESAAN